MSTDEQIDLFGAFYNESASAPESKVSAPEIEPEKKKLVGRRKTPNSDRSEKTIELGHYLMDCPDRYYVIRLPKPLVVLPVFPATPQKSWKVTHSRKNYTIETGVSEAYPDKATKCVVIRDLGYLLAINTLIQNTPKPPNEIEFTARHLGYILAGFPKLTRSIGNSDNFVSGRTTKDLASALDNMYQRHMRYTNPGASNSSDPEDEHFLQLIGYNSLIRKRLIPGGKHGRIYQNFDIYRGFERIAPNWEKDTYPVDVRMFFRAKTEVARGVLWYLLPRLMAGKYMTPGYTLKLDAIDLLRNIGASVSSYRDPGRALATIKNVHKRLDGLESVLNSRLHTKVGTGKGKRPYLRAYLEDTKSELRKKDLESATGKLWIAEGGDPGKYLSLLQTGRSNKIYYNEMDEDSLDGIILDLNQSKDYLTRAKHVLGITDFRQSLAEFKSAVKEGRAGADPKHLTGFIKDAIRIKARRSKK